MSSVAAIGDADQVVGLVLAGVIVRIAVGHDAVEAAWQNLPDDVGLVILDAGAAADLGAMRSSRSNVLTVVMPQ